MYGTHTLLSSAFAPALEVNAGFFNDNNLKLGDSVAFVLEDAPEKK
ncbi:MAG TPA: hypothetical protein VJG29_00845 [Candidatus Paceibacterota bacterium]